MEIERFGCCSDLFFNNNYIFMKIEKLDVYLNGILKESGIDGYNVF